MASLGSGWNAGASTSNMHDTLMRNRRPRPSPELDVWLHPSSGAPSPQPHFSFPVSGTNSPYSVASNHDSPSYFDEKSSPMVVTDSNSSFTPLKGSPRTGLGLNWRESSLEASRRYREDQAAARRRKYVLGGLSAFALTVVVLLLRKGRTQDVVGPRSQDNQSKQAMTMSSLAPLFSSAAKRSDATSFRDELSTDMKYLISPQHGDFAEQIMNFYHLTHLASVLSRIPLVSPFALPMSDSDSAPLHLPFSSVFDMPRFTAHTNVYAIDWTEIRPSQSNSRDKLGCWLGTVDSVDQIRTRALAMKENGVDVSFFPLRASAGERAAGEGDQVLATHNFLAKFEQDSAAQEGLIEQARHVSAVTTHTSSIHTDPEDHILCFDHSLYRPEHPTTSHMTTHLDPRDHTAFHTHGRALHYLPELQDAALDIAAFVLGSRTPFIVVHIDAKAQALECTLRHQDAAAEAACAVPKLDTYVQAVERVRSIATRSAGKKQSREQRAHARALPVLVSTDVTDLAFKGELAAAGWSLLDFDDLEVRQRLGPWPAAVIEGVVHSKATAFVGTRGSSLSTLSALRVRDWRAGPTELVY